MLGGAAMLDTRTLMMFASSLVLSGCMVGAPGGEGDESNEDDSTAVEATRRVLLCEQGLSDRTTGWDKGLFALCDAVAAKGFELVKDGSYSAFGALNENGAYSALFKKLDTNGDGRVDGKDTPTKIHLVGFSWGGINVTDIADRLRKDSRIAQDRRTVTAMVLLDPYQPLSFHANIPSNVEYAWEYRQSNTTDGDCSSTVSLGLGFNGKTPEAKSWNTWCSVYDLDSFMNGVGHCDVPSRAKDAAITNLTKLEDYAPWDDHMQWCDVDD